MRSYIHYFWTIKEKKLLLLSYKKFSVEHEKPQIEQVYINDEEDLLLNKNGERMKNDAINNVLRRLNRMIETPQKGNHSIRKTCISNMGESRLLSDEEIRKFAGHKDFATTEKYYMHVTTSIENRSDAYEKAINSKISNVFKRVQTV